MAFPTLSIGHVSPRDGFFMTPLAVGLGNPSPPIGEANIFGDPPGIKDKGVPHTGQALPGQMVDDLIIGQMTVNAFDSAMSPLMPPGLVFGLHDMAAGAEFWGSGCGV
jgi:hypothetical protein